MSERSDCFVSQGQGFGSRKRGKFLLTKIHRALVAKEEKSMLTKKQRALVARREKVLLTRKNEKAGAAKTMFGVKMLMMSGGANQSQGEKRKENRE